MPPNSSNNNVVKSGLDRSAEVHWSQCSSQQPKLLYVTSLRLVTRGLKVRGAQRTHHAGRPRAYLLGLGGRCAYTLGVEVLRAGEQARK